MALSPNYFRLRTGARAFAPEALTLFAAMSSQPTSARASLINSTILNLQALGVWDSLDILYVLAAATSQAALLNWKSPSTFTAIEVASPTFAADQGYTGNGSSSYLRTQFTPSTNGVQYLQDSASIWCWSRTQATNTNRCIGSLAGGGLGAFKLRTGGGNFQGGINDGTNADIAVSPTSIGMFGLSRVSSATRRAWLNGTQLGSDSSVASTARPSSEAYILASNSDEFTSYQMSLAAWGGSLEGKENDFYRVMNTYMQAVGALA